MHPLLADLLRWLPDAVHDPLPAEPPRDRSGWFHASDLSDGDTVRFDPRFCVEQYLGLAPRKRFTPESALAIGLGRGVDQLFRGALRRCRDVSGTQVELTDPALRLSGTPDFLYLPWGEALPGDVKACGPKTFRHYWANPEWPLSRAYFWRQLQAYLLLTGATEALLVVIDRSGCERHAKLTEVVAVREFQRDAACQDGIRRDLAYLATCVDRYAAAAPAQRAAALPPC